MSELAQSLESRIRQALPDATVSIHDPDGAHLFAVVTSGRFVGLNRIQQHRLVYAALGNAFENELHALQLSTKIPE